mmetsp:Transcript_69046/g.136868  ORF Transcript_69046/g.136868 Transcript_69046/m.136868 type:complete len:219 (-) Transcript_69046:74-730(-)
MTKCYGLRGTFMFVFGRKLVSASTAIPPENSLERRRMSRPGCTRSCQDASGIVGIDDALLPFCFFFFPRRSVVCPAAPPCCRVDGGGEELPCCRVDGGGEDSGVTGAPMPTFGRCFTSLPARCLRGGRSFISVDSVCSTACSAALTASSIAFTSEALRGNGKDGKCCKCNGRLMPASVARIARSRSVFAANIFPLGTLALNRSSIRSAPAFETPPPVG